MTAVSPNCNTSQTPTRLPTPHELAAAAKALSDASALTARIQWSVQRIARAEQVSDYPELGLVTGDEIPTLAHIGMLYVFVVEARYTLEELERHMDTVEDKLLALDTVRIEAPQEPEGA